MTVLRTAWPLVALGVGASALGISATYFTDTFLVAWATTDLGAARQTMLDVLLSPTSCAARSSAAPPRRSPSGC
ncbi:hypothetical protein [Nonomuraea gerenzanensis]|uniref:hypothetical protein n=1 Tax=Nonomuraea gerenzanensis TaxID=93944 RepID=UPI001CD9A5D8|nr:hypothetical protein [Nonomuraea gerenzanensis]UBU08819.1 hypothetical protein LCN96_31035 [Nonomuraea gerenzanensis]